MSYDDSYLRDQLRSLEVTIQENAPTLRERLICAALTGICAHPTIEGTPNQLAQEAIAQADAVLAVLDWEKTKKSETMSTKVT